MLIEIFGMDEILFILVALVGLCLTWGFYYWIITAASRSRAILIEQKKQTALLMRMAINYTMTEASVKDLMSKIDAEN